LPLLRRFRGISAEARPQRLGVKGNQRPAQKECRRAGHSANRARREGLFFAGSDAGRRRVAIIHSLRGGRRARMQTYAAAE
jgi:hypothetical protein